MNNKKQAKRKILLPAEAGTLVNDNIYFFSSEYNLLYKVHLPDLEISIVSRIPCDKAIASKWFRKMRYWNGKLILTPSCAEKIWIYDLNSGEWTDIAIKYPHISLKFWGTVLYQDCAYLFGAAYPAILKVDLNDHSVSYLNAYSLPEQKKDEDGLFCTDAIKMGNIAFSPASISNHVLQLNLDTDEYVWQQVGSDGNEYCGIDRDEDGFWIPSWQHGKIVNWDGDSEWKEFNLPEELANRRYQFTGVVCDGNKIRFLTIQDGKSLDLRKNDLGERCFTMTEATAKYVHIEHYENDTIVLMRNDAALDVKWQGTWLSGRCDISYKDFVTFFGGEALWEFVAEKGIANETKIFHMSDYVKIVAEEQNCDTDYLGADSAGINIWKMLG